MLNRDVRIKLSAGAIVLAVLHAILLAVCFQTLHLAQPERKTPLPLDHHTLNANDHHHGDYFTASPERMLPPVNVSARDEVKQQGGTYCPQCDIAEANQIASQHRAVVVAVRDFRTNTVQVYASLSGGRRWVSSGKSVTQTYVGINAHKAVISDMQRGVMPADVPQLPAVQPAISPTVPAVQPTSKKKYQLALFVGNDSQSQQLLEWFRTNPELHNLSTHCEVQVYTPENGLYKARYATQVPADQFPAMLFLKSDGGHIHAAGRSMLPNSAEALVSDLRHSIELAKSAASAPMQTGMIRETGYSWDSSINPQMRLQPSDCLDGSCDPSDDSRLPGFGGGLLDRVRKPAEAVVWAGATEIAVVLLIGLAGVLVVVIALKRR